MEQQVLKTFQSSADRAVGWLLGQMNNDGTLQLPAEDLACYYKVPYLLFVSGKMQEANRMLSYIQRAFGRKNGDFTTSGNLKSENGNFIEYWAYMNGWISLNRTKDGTI